jgi:thiol:disulfide interchange protein DsbD
MNSNIVITGTIDEGWHLYSQKTPANAGPIPVTVNITKKNGLKLIGKFQEKLEPHEIFDVNFDSKVYLFEHSYLAYQKIKINNTNKIIGNVQYMVCNDTQCLPPIEVPFTLIIN